MTQYTKSKYYQARIKCTDKWVRTLAYDPQKDAYICRSGKKKEWYWADELADFCT